MDQGEIRLRVALEITLFERARPVVTPDIDAVFVFSGPGTFLSPLKGDNQEAKRWSDQIRISEGIWLVLKVTALRLDKSVQEVTSNDISLLGPTLIYNGIPIENEVFRAVSILPQFPLPKSRIVLIDEVEEDGRMIPIRHTGDQVKSFPSYLLGNTIVGAVALVSNAPHFPRILRYLNKYRPIPHERFPIRCFPIPSRPELAALYAVEEVEALCRYLKRDQLSENPYPVGLGLDILDR